MKKIISPSILSADFSNLQSVCEMINRSEAEWIHIDVMDGIFVPNISFAFPVMEAIKKHCTKMMDVHLMIEHPENYITRFKEAGAGNITFHFETVRNPFAVIEQIKKEGIMAGITVNPDVPVEVLEPFIKDVDMVLLMTVFAGYGGQQYIEESDERIRKVHAMIEKHHPSCFLEVDGGVHLQNAAKLYECGANVIVAGSSVFNTADQIGAIHDLLFAH
jgi:ribulose-phosphate 3-epimerase